MTPEFATEMIKSLMFEAMVLATPILLTALLVGLAVSLFQAVTSINEQTLSFVPKVLAMSGVIIVLLPWFIRTCTEFATAVIQKIPQMTQ
jgi:flagellar biosynthesis protein FliQ